MIYFFCVLPVFFEDNFVETFSIAQQKAQRKWRRRTEIWRKYNYKWTKVINDLTHGMHSILAVLACLVADLPASSRIFICCSRFACVHVIVPGKNPINNRRTKTNLYRLNIKLLVVSYITSGKSEGLLVTSTSSSVPKIVCIK
jgi:hypothetical protein